jgi:hypothetical protein
LKAGWADGRSGHVRGARIKHQLEIGKAKKWLKKSCVAEGPREKKQWLIKARLSRNTVLQSNPSQYKSFGIL